MITDVAIIGGGAAGLCAAVYLKQKNPAVSVKLFEALPRVGKKIAVTGNGRCNITNKNIKISRYHGNDVSFCRYALEKYNTEVTRRFFHSIGVDFIFEEDKAFPASLQAGSVVDCLRFAAENLGVKILVDTKVTNIQLVKNNYKIIADKMSFLAPNVIIAAGLYSGGDKLGCDGSMLKLLEKAGFGVVKTTPAITQIKTETDIVKQLKGIKVDALVTLKNQNGILRQEFGETLFCDYGLSGPPVLQVSRFAAREKNSIISLDIMPDTDYTTIYEALKERAKRLYYLNADEFLTGFLNKRLGQVIVKLSGVKMNESVKNITDLQLQKVASLIKDFSFKVTGNTGFANSQVTAGGLDTKQFDDKTMMSKADKGLYCAGEILDIDGDCGGFNLQWAWSSAMCAADSVLEGLK